jgi:anti-anti-sigma regulatory factor
VATAHGQDQARCHHGRRRRGERGGRGGHRGRAAFFYAARRRGGQHDQQGERGREHPGEQRVVVGVRQLIVDADRDLRVGARHVGRDMMAGVAGQDGWLTTVVRPAGSLDHAALARLSAALGVLEPSSDMVVVDLTAADVRDPGDLARHLLAPARRFDQAGRCLLLVGASPRVERELRRSAVPVVTLAPEVVHGRAA